MARRARAHLHYKVEGRQSYAGLLFVPHAAVRLVRSGAQGRVKLYVRRVFITDDAELLPSWLRFVRGVVDSEDLPLNVSREMLQNNPPVAQIRNGLTGACRRSWKARPPRTPEVTPRSGRPSARSSRKGSTRTFERRDQLLAPPRFAADGEGRARSRTMWLISNPTRPTSTTSSAIAPSVCKPIPSSRRRARAASRCCCSPIRSMRSGLDAAGVRGQAVEVAEPGRCRLRPHPPCSTTRPRTEEGGRANDEVIV